MLRALFLFLIAFPFLLLSQTDPVKQKKKAGHQVQTANYAKVLKVDSLHDILKKDSAFIYRFRKLRPYFNYHERHSLNNPITTNFYGPQLGVVLYERHIVGFGFYFSGKKTREPFETFDENMKVTKNINVNYFTCFYQYILVNHRYFEFHLPVEIGSGTFSSTFKDSLNQTYKDLNTPFYESSAGLHLILKPLRWIGLSSTIGYRVASEKYFTGFFYSFGVWVGFRHALNDSRYLVKKKKYKKNVKMIMGF